MPASAMMELVHISEPQAPAPAPAILDEPPAPFLTAGSLRRPSDDQIPILIGSALHILHVFNPIDAPLRFNGERFI